MPDTCSAVSAPEVLIFCSDQHTAQIAGFMGDRIVRTPHLDRIAAEGAVFDNAYTSCPLCAPARASLLTAKVPSRMEIYNNACDYRSSEITFAHLFALRGYEATLIGRMHFNGMDFYHGFTKRVGKDITGSYWGYGALTRLDLGDFARSMQQRTCLEVIGSGDTPVREYDRTVIADALEYLTHDYKKPQMIVVGTYGPHFPYVGDERRMEHYRRAMRNLPEEKWPDFAVPSLRDKVQQTTREDLAELRAAYYALVEEMDEQVGRVYDAFQTYLERSGKEGIFIYMSDHGDQLGYKGLYGKQTFFERSAKIPLIFSGTGISGRRVRDSVSIMDIGPTLCHLVGAQPYPEADGVSFLPSLKGESHPERQAVSEFYDPFGGDCCVGRMIHRDGKKLICYNTEAGDMLFDTEQDPDETQNLVAREPELYLEMKERLMRSPVGPDRQAGLKPCLTRHKILAGVGAEHPEWNPFTYTASDRVRRADESCKRPKRC